MKNIIQYIIIITLGVTILPGCKKLDEVNKNPNNPTSLAAAPSVQLTATELMIGYTSGGDNFRFTGIFDGQCTYNGANARQFNQFGTYQIPTNNFEASWGNAYEAMLNLQDLIAAQQKQSNWGYVGIAQVLLAYELGMNSDLYNSMPFSQAFQPTKYLQPAFDNQQGLYDTIQRLLASAQLNLGASNTQTFIPGADDVVYKGNLTQWQGLAYALSARFYLHLRKVDGTALAKAQAAVTSAIGKGFAPSASDPTAAANDAYFHFGSAAANANPMYQFLQNRQGEVSFIGAGNPACYADSLMVAISDPRLPFLIDTSANDWLGTYYNQANSPVVIMTTAELAFIQAEISFINGDKTTAATSTNTGVAASVLDITGSPATAPFLTTYGTFTAANITLQSIIQQKYIALFTNPEVFSDYRRTGYPNIVALPGALTSIPRRFLYSDIETNLNKNTPSVQLTDRVWWDVP